MKAEITAESMARIASQKERASAAALMTVNLAKKPAVKGTPAWASRSTMKAALKMGRRLAKPL